MINKSINKSGAVYVFIIIVLLFYVNAAYTCPAVLGDYETTGNCVPYVYAAFFIFSQIVLNFVLFHYYRLVVD